MSKTTFFLKYGIFFGIKRLISMVGLLHKNVQIQIQVWRDLSGKSQRIQMVPRSFKTKIDDQVTVH
jgi:hypothetical protein